MISLMQLMLGLLTGTLVGFSLGLVGGGGSVLAVPLLVYFVGLHDPHLAIGTSAVAVTVNAALSLAAYARAGQVKWPCSLTFATAGILGALVGSTLGKAINGEHLLALFAVVMMVIALVMLKRRGAAGDPAVRLSRATFPRVAGVGMGSGALSGFFGIGGGFLIVPGLVLSTGMPMLNAVGSSLVAVTAFGLTTSANYALSGLVSWPLAAMVVGGGTAGGLVGMRLSKVLAGQKGRLNLAFAVIVFSVGLYVLARSLIG